MIDVQMRLVATEKGRKGKEVKPNKARKESKAREETKGRGRESKGSKGNQREYNQ